MFEKWESKSYPNADAKVIHAHALNWWQQNGFRVQETGPGQFTGRSASKWGLEREVNATVRDVAGTAVVELRLKANVTEEGVIGEIEAFGKKSFPEEVEVSTEKRLADAEMIDGLPFESLEHVIMFKRRQGREKDLRDLELLKQWQASREGT